ncbi:MAG: hypothetical protein K6G56_05895 [Clostridiales bacterium]|nr:hypothetical protein [Clostridiales bacterium]
MKRTIKTTPDPEAASYYELFREFYEAYAGERARIRRCEAIYRGDHWYDVPVGDRNEPRPVTPVIHSAIENVRADLDEYVPEAVITADSASYAELADTLTRIIKEDHMNCAYDEEYRKVTHDLLVCGYAVQEIGYDPEAAGGMGSAFIRHVDVGSVLFDPLVSDIQEGRAVMKFARRTRDWFREHYPKEAEDLSDDGLFMDVGGDGVLTPRYDKSIMLIECWIRKYDAKKRRYSVHVLKLAGGMILEDSRKAYPAGVYAHGEYPFVITALFPRKGSALGYGFVDMFETSQRYSDKLDQVVMKNALMASHNKLLVTGSSGFDVEDLRDWSKDVHRGDNLNGVTWFQTAPLPAYLIQYIADMRDTIKEESGANDWSRGMTNYGVTSGTAISALQEKSSKRARMAAKSLHSAFRRAVEQELELEREFALGLRCIKTYIDRSDPEGAKKADKAAREVMRMEDMPISIRVTVKVQKSSGFSAIAHNDTVFRLVETGMITPEVGLELIVFEGREQAKALMKEKAAEGLPKGTGLPV